MHDTKLAKMEAEMLMVFQQKVAEKETKLKQSEEELYSRHREMKDALEKQRLELDDKKRRIESGRPLTPENKVVSFYILLDKSNKFEYRQGSVSFERSCLDIERWVFPCFNLLVWRCLSSVFFAISPSVRSYRTLSIVFLPSTCGSHPFVTLYMPQDTKPNGLLARCPRYLLLPYSSLCLSLLLSSITSLCLEFVYPVSWDDGFNDVPLMLRDFV